METTLSQEEVEFIDKILDSTIDKIAKTNMSFDEFLGIKWEFADIEDILYNEIKIVNGKKKGK